MSDRTRWWDYYFVRYFVGTIFGIALLLWLQMYARICTSGQCEVGTASPWLTATAIGAIGLAFCYLASAPVLVLHALRFQFPSSSRFFERLGFAAVLLILAGSLCLALSYHSAGSQPTPAASWFTPFGIVMLCQAWLLCRWPADVTGKRYRELALQRGRDQQTLYGKKKGEYIESYRHLREHGNAFSILFVELILALAVAAAPSWLFVGGLIALWILPAAFAWFIGTWLEFGISEV